MPEPFKVVVCGGGNGAHVFSGIASSKENVDIRVLTLFQDEAERWTKIMAGSGFKVTARGEGENGGDKVYTSKPSMVTKDPELAVKGSHCIVFCVPAFAHRQYFETIKPFVTPGTTIVGLPGACGFEFAANGILGEKAKGSCMMSFESLPWACRIVEFGKQAEAIGTKGTMMGAIHGNMEPTVLGKDPLASLQYCLGPRPHLVTEGHLLGITLMATNAVIHPSIMFGRWSQWDGKPLDGPPLFYQGCDTNGAQLMSSVSDEVVSVAHALQKQRPHADLKMVKHILEWYRTTYSQDISDQSTLLSCLNTNKSYAGLKHPMKPLDDGKYVPDFTYRYLTEDIPYGLVVTRGIASAVGVATPNIDKIITWAQKQIGREYLVNGKLQGKDIGGARCPQSYGLTTIDQILGD